MKRASIVLVFALCITARSNGFQQTGAAGMRPHTACADLAKFWFPFFFNAYRQRDYGSALEVALKINMPGFWRTQVAFAAAHGQLGEQDAARRTVRELLKIKPDFAVVGRDELRKWYDPDLTDHLIEGLAKAGLEVR